MVTTTSPKLDERPPAAPGKPGPTGEIVPCPKCGATEPWGRASWCPTCGYYPQLGTVVDPEARPGQQEVPVGPVSLREAIPPWGWLCGGGVVAIFFASLICRVAVPSDSIVRLLWTLLQFVAGSVAAFCAQVTAYLAAVPKTDKIHPFDVFLKPIEIWTPTIEALPRTAPRVCLIAWGGTAVFCALVVTGGIAWSSIFDDWGFQKSADAKLVQALARQARQEQEGSADAARGGESEKEEPAKPVTKADCVIVGYAKTPEGKLQSLVVASTVNGELQVVGTVSAETIPEEAQQTLLERMGALERDEPLLKSRYAATWLEPVLACRIAHEDWTKDKQVNKPKFEELLKDIGVE